MHRKGQYSRKLEKKRRDETDPIGLSCHQIFRLKGSGAGTICGSYLYVHVPFLTLHSHFLPWERSPFPVSPPQTPHQSLQTNDYANWQGQLSRIAHRDCAKVSYRSCTGWLHTYHIIQAFLPPQDSVMLRSFHASSTGLFAWKSFLFWRVTEKIIPSERKPTFKSIDKTHRAYTKSKYICARASL